MHLKGAGFLCLLFVLMLAASSFAQEGHPLVGVWYGDWGSTPAQRNQITVVMSYDGKNVTGLVNPGPESFPLKLVTLDSTKWTVHIEADGKDAKGAPAHFVGDGKLENIGSYHRTLTGSWNYGATKGDFKIKRD
ncbi:MAG: hypothetical protein DMG11_24540 [Acidobacteria bacterium]|nr:MAG: hypothetical protein DMG11_24540 [Acidobacteriota bacterium]